ncbi:MAG: tetratricopeptide repeat protein [bacterium]
MNKLIRKGIKKVKTEIIFSKGQKYAERQQFDEAINIYRKALQVNPFYSGVYLHLGLALAEEKKYDEAVESISKAIDLWPGNPVYYIFLGRIHIDQKRYDKALKILEKSIEMDKTNLLAHDYQALAYLGQNEIAKGFALLEGKSLSNVSHFQARLLVWIELFLLKKEGLKEKSDQSVSLEKGTQVTDDNCYEDKVLNKGWFKCILLYLKARRCIKIGLKKMERKEYAVAIEKFKQAFSLWPKVKNIYSYLGQAHFHNEECKMAIPYLTKALSQNPKNFLILHQLGIAFYKLGDFIKSEEYLMKANELNPMLSET